ncbi:hypothetical protein KBC99_00295 [Candidatus Saccharibacteria bacterium]|nr:hypothetical protein [Candidatus Saccharibacteria bacterium]
MTFVSMILAFIVVGGLLVYLQGMKAQGNTPKQPANAPETDSKPALDTDLVMQRWREIEAMQGHGGMGLKNALMEADKLLDYVMQAKGMQGETMGDRLKLNGQNFSDLNGIWAAHKLRNQIAHEVAIDIVPNQVQDAIRKLKVGLQDLGVRLG